VVQRKQTKLTTPPVTSKMMRSPSVALSRRNRVNLELLTPYVSLT
jgi:hypothetical protein